LYEQLLGYLGKGEARVFDGRFGAHMRVELVNDGPVTLILDSPTAPSPEGRNQSVAPGDAA
jgi:hypothetical protein